jgi:hypothetical protein
LRRIGISITLLAIMFLIISALNISNAGINQLTGEDRKAVLAVKMEDKIYACSSWGRNTSVLKHLPIALDI